MLESSGSAIALLAILVVFQGVRHLPEGTIVLTHSPFGRSRGWELIEPFALGRGFYVVAWFIPVWLPLILPVRPAEQSRVTAGKGGRVDGLTGTLLVLRVLGFLSALLLVLGLPLAAGRFGVWGFLIALAALLVLCVVQGLIEAFARRRLGASWWQTIGIALSCLWPFTAPLAAERVLAVTMGLFPREVLVRQLLDETAFAESFRRELYDESHGREPEVSADLRPALREHLAKAGNAPPSIPDAPRYCPRCGAGFNNDVPSCTDCDDVVLLAREG